MENKRRNIEEVKKRVIWIYGAPFCGKTTFANGFPDPLMINTDGNILYVDAPYIRIKDDVKVEGRMTKRTLAWENFKDTVTELEKRDNDFRTIVVDLLEDLYEHCRCWCLDNNTDTDLEYISSLKRIVNLDYENIILISNEGTIKPDISDMISAMVNEVLSIEFDGEKVFAYPLYATTKCGIIRV